jgi:microcystin-dependent protein
MADKNLKAKVGIGTSNSIMGHVPVGTIILYAGASIPNGWLECNGQTAASATYPALAAFLGTNYGGTVSSPLVPNLNAKYVRGAQNSSNTIGATSNSITSGDAVSNETYGNSGGARTSNTYLAHTHSTGYEDREHAHSWGNSHTGSNPTNLAMGTGNVTNSTGQSHNHVTSVGGGTSNIVNALPNSYWHFHGNTSDAATNHEHTGGHTHTTTSLTSQAFRYIIKY